MTNLIGVVLLLVRWLSVRDGRMLIVGQPRPFDLVAIFGVVQVLVVLELVALTLLALPLIAPLLVVLVLPLSTVLSLSVLPILMDLFSSGPASLLAILGPSSAQQMIHL